jgi:uncharacterized protein involved in outer membrane biogenesis
MPPGSPRGQLPLPFPPVGLYCQMTKVQKVAVWVAAIFGGLLLIYTLVGILLVPRVAERQIESRASEALSRQVVVERVEFNPFTFRAAINGLTVADAVAPQGELLAVRMVEARFSPWRSIRAGAWTVTDVRIAEPVIRLVRAEDGRLNISDLWDRPEQEKDLPALAVAQLRLEQGTVEFIDLSASEPWQRVIEPVQVRVTDFSTVGANTARYQLEARTDAGETLTASGRFGIEPAFAEGSAAVAGVQWREYAHLLPATLRPLMSTGRFSWEGAYQLQMDEEGELQQLAMRDAVLRAEDLQMVLPGETEPVAQVPVVEIVISEADLVDLTVKVDRVTVQRPSLRIERHHDGTLNLAQLADLLPDQPDPAKETMPARPPLFVEVVEAVVQNGRIDVQDRSMDEPAAWRIEPFQLTVRGASSELDRPMTVDLLAELSGAQRAELRVSGEVQPAPLAAELRVTAQNVSLPDFQSVVQELVAVEVTSGRVDVDGTFTVKTIEGEPTSLRWAGSMAVVDVELRDSAFGEELLSWNQLVVEGARLATAPLRLVIDRVRWHDPVAQVVVGADGTLNLAALFAREDEPAPAEGEPVVDPEAVLSPSIPLEVRVAELQLEGGSIGLSDYSMDTPFSVLIWAIRGEIREWSTDPEAQAEVALAATFEREAPIAIQGTVNPRAKNLLAAANLSFDITNLRLDIFQPYVERFLGYEVEQGVMRADFEYKLSQGRLQGVNRILLDHFLLGDAVESTEAIDAPVRLGLAAMRDRHDQIELEIPVDGSLSDPNFSFGALMRHAAGNVFKRIATAPFAFLGNLLGLDGGEEMAQVTFSAGKAELSEAARQQLKKVAHLLHERPWLSLRINWVPDPGWDDDALREERLRQLEQRYRDRLAAEVDEATEEDALRQLYADRFPEGVPPPTAAVEEGEQPRSWVARAFASLFGGTREPEPAADEVGPTVEEMRNRLLATIDINEAEQASLAQRRAQVVRDVLIEAGVELERLEVAEESGAAAGAREPETEERIYLALQEGGTTRDVAVVE